MVEQGVEDRRQRYSDVIQMRWSDMREGQIRVEQDETRKKLWIPMHKALKRVLKDVPRSSEFILTSERGTAWTANGFHTAWHREMKERSSPAWANRSAFSIGYESPPW